MVITEEGGILMTKVLVRNGNVDGALRVMKQQGIKNGDQKKAKERELGYLKPGVQRRNAKKEGIKNTRRRQRQANRY